MGGATCGLGATKGRSGGGGGPRPHASKPRGGWGDGGLAAGGGDGGAEGARCACAGAVKARVARATKAYATEVLGILVMGAPSQTVGTSFANGNASLLAQLQPAPSAAPRRTPNTAKLELRRHRHSSWPPAIAVGVAW